METPSRHSFDLDGATRVFPIPSPIKGDNYCRLEVDGTIINDRAKYDIVNNSIVFIDVADVPDGSQLDVLVVQSEEAIGQLSITTNIDIVASNISTVNFVGGSIADINTLADIAADIQTLADIEDGTDSTDAIQTVAGVSTNVTTVAGSIANVNTVSGNIANVNIVAGNNTIVSTVASNIASVNTVASNINDVITVANDLNEAISEIEVAALDLQEATSEIEVVANNIANVNKVGAIDTDVTTVAGIDTNVTTVSGISGNVTTVAGISSNVTTVAGISSDVSTVAADGTDIGTVSTNIANVNTVAGISGNVTTVAGNNANVTTVAGISSDVTAVAGISANVTAVANDATDIGTVATNITNVNNVGGSIANVNSVATNLSSVNDFAARYRVSATEPTTSLDEGDLWFDTAADVMKVYGGGGWANAGSSVNGTSARFKYVATSGQTTFTGADANGVTLAYDAGYIDVYLNGVHLDPSDYTATSGSSVVLASGAALNDELYIVAFGTFSVATHVAKSGDSMTGNLSFGDNDKAIFGAGSDLQIYHDGSHSYIHDAGTGNLRIAATNFYVYDQATSVLGMAAIANDRVEINYAGSKKFATTSTGIDVTGTVTADGLTVDGDITINDNSPTLTFLDANGVDQNFNFAVNGGTANIQSRTDAGVNTTRFRVETNGDISFYEDTGTTPKFFWDASAEFLGIGMSSPNSPLTVVGDPGGIGYSLIGRSSDGYSRFQSWDRSGTVKTGALAFFEDGSISFNRGNTGTLIEHMRIDSSGNVGIGNSTAGYTLTSGETRLAVGNGSEHAAIQIYSGTNKWGALAFTDDTTGGVSQGWVGYYHPSDYMTLVTNGSERVRIDSSGNVLVGKTSSDYATPGIELGNDGGVGLTREGRPLFLRRNASDGQMIQFNRGASQVGEITSNTTSTSYVTSSDYRLKEDVQPMSGSIDRVKQLKPCNFAWKADGSRVDGFLAHEAQAVVPEAVVGTKDAVDADGNPVYQGIDQSKLVPLLTSALQEAIAEIDSLKARVAALENNNGN